MYRRVAYFVIALMALLGSGTLMYLHQLQHEREDAELLALTPQTPGHPQPNTPPLHNDSNCPIHARLHAPTLAAGNVASLIDTGLCVRHISMLALHQHSQTTPQRISCRGPPINLLPSA